MSKKLLIAAVVAMIAIGSTMAMATESRIECLGSQGLYLMDDTNIFGNPAMAAKYSKMVRLHMAGIDGSGDTHAYGGGTMSITDGLTLGLFVARNPEYEEGGIGWVVSNTQTSGSMGPISGPVFTDPYTLGSTDAFVNWKNPFDIILAYQMGDMAFGISYYLANGKMKYEDNIPGGDDDDTETIEGTAKLHSLKLGMTYAMGNIKSSLYFHWDPYKVKGTYEFDDDASGGDFETEHELSGSKIVLGGRMFYNMNDNLALVPAIRWEHVGGEVTIDWDDDNYYAGDTTEEDLEETYKYNTVTVGMSAQYRADRLFLVTSAALKWSKYVQEFSIDTDDVDWTETSTSKTFAVPEVAMGLEYQAAKWACLRGGIKTTTIWASSTSMFEEEEDGDELADNSLMQTVQSTTANIGAGLTFGNLMIDMTFGNFVLTNEDGNDGLSGGPNLFSHLDAKYVFP